MEEDDDDDQVNQEVAAINSGHKKPSKKFAHQMKNFRMAGSQITK